MIVTLASIGGLALVEGLKGITWLEDFGPEVARRRLIVFSDTLQNTDGLSHYRPAGLRPLERHEARLPAPDVSPTSK